MSSLEKATLEDFDAVIAFYDQVIDHTPEIELHARWKKEAHPTKKGLKAYIQEGSLYLYREEGAIIGAMALPMYQGEDYHAVDWSVKLPDDQVASLHILGVRPDRQGKGIASEMVRGAIELAKSNGKKAVRLDTLDCNTPAQRLYQSLGFEYRGKQHLYAENTAWIDFFFFEYNF